MRKISPKVYIYLLAALLLASCNAGVITEPTPTEVPTQTPIPTNTPLPTPTHTPTPEYSLNCEIIIVPIEEKNRPLNVFAMSTSLEEGYEDNGIEGLQIDILGEAKLSVTFGKAVTRFDLNTGRLWVEIDEEWTYLESGHIYGLKGVVNYDKLLITSYDLVVTGGGFGPELQTCKK